jgi:pilus assembly protein Flp/PilA
MKKIIDFLRDEEGAALPEYALLVALIAVVCIVGMRALATGVNAQLTAVGGTITNPTP